MSGFEVKMNPPSTYVCFLQATSTNMNPICTTQTQNAKEALSLDS